jgi:hypothetical protein
MTDRYKVYTKVMKVMKEIRYRNSWNDYHFGSRSKMTERKVNAQF